MLLYLQHRKNYLAFHFRTYKVSLLQPQVALIPYVKFAVDSHSLAPSGA